MAYVFLYVCHYHKSMHCYNCGSTESWSSFSGSLTGASTTSGHKTTCICCSVLPNKVHSFNINGIQLCQQCITSLLLVKGKIIDYIYYVAFLKKNSNKRLGQMDKALRFTYKHRKNSVLTCTTSLAKLVFTDFLPSLNM